MKHTKMPKVTPLLFFGTFKENVKLLKKRLKPMYPMRISWDYEGSEAGYCVLRGSKKKYFEIRINKYLDENTAVLILLHEISHAHSWDSDKLLPGDHNAIWGIAYSRAYKICMNTF